MDTLHEEQCTFFIYLAQFFLEWEIIWSKFVEEIQTLFIIDYVSQKSYRL